MLLVDELKVGINRSGEERHELDADTDLLSPENKIVIYLLVCFEVTITPPCTSVIVSYDHISRVYE